jgi:hypothetical protein
MKRWWPLGVIAASLVLGSLVCAAGWMYDVVFAGIPYQDPTPELAARYTLNAQIASLIRWVGAGICASGGLLGGALLVWTVLKKMRQSIT